MERTSLLKLLATRRFGPFFATQFLGAFNDNVFRQALILLITSGVVTGVSANTLNNLALALFILPFFLFSALAGQLADRFEKSTLIRILKLWELVLMLLAALAFWHQAVWWLLAILFFMGLQSTAFGPLKYSIMPQHLPERELVSGNALVQQGTYVAILLGSLLGVVLNMQGAARWWGPAAAVLVAFGGVLSAWRIPRAAPADPQLRINWNLLAETGRVLGHARQNRDVWKFVLCISWFWFLGAAYTTQLKVYVDDYLGGGEALYAVLLSVFSIGIGTGSVLCEKLSARKVNLGLVPWGGAGITLFALDLYFSYLGIRWDPATLTWTAFLAEPQGWRILLDLFGIGVSGGFYIVPLFTLVQWRGRQTHLSRIIGACNVMNALFMVGSAVAGILVVGVAGRSIPEFFLMLGLAQGVMLLLFWWRTPDARYRARALWGPRPQRLRILDAETFMSTAGVILCDAEPVTLRRWLSCLPRAVQPLTGEAEAVRREVHNGVPACVSPSADQDWTGLRVWTLTLQDDGTLVLAPRVGGTAQDDKESLE